MQDWFHIHRCTSLWFIARHSEMHFPPVCVSIFGDAFPHSSWLKRGEPHLHTRLERTLSDLQELKLHRLFFLRRLRLGASKWIVTKFHLCCDCFLVLRGTQVQESASLMTVYTFPDDGDYLVHASFLCHLGRPVWSGPCARRKSSCTDYFLPPRLQKACMDQVLLRVKSIRTI